MHTYVSQFAFRGHDSSCASETAPQQVLKQMVDVEVGQQHRHPDITDDLIAANPFVFLLNSAKLATFKDSGVLKIQVDFDLFNRRTQYPYDTIENPMKLD